MDLNERKKLVGIRLVDSSDEVIPIYELDFSNPEELLKFKPLTSQISDELWVAQAVALGVFHALNHDFQDWMDREVKAGRLPRWLGDAEASLGQGMLEIYFGEAGKKVRQFGWDKFGKTAEKFKERCDVEKKLLLENRWLVEELGAFGRWLIEAGVAQNYVKEIMKEFLED